MIKERYIFLSELNLDILLYLDYFRTFIFSYFTSDEGVYNLSILITPSIVLFFIFLFFIFYFHSVTSNLLKKNFTDILFLIPYSGIICFLLYLLSPDGLLFIILFPFLLLILGLKFNNLIFSLLTITLGIFSSGSLAFLYTCSSLLFLDNKKLFLIKYLILPFSLVYTFYVSSNSNLFDYPREGRTVPISPLINLSSPLIGPEKLPFHLNPERFVSNVYTSALLLLPFIISTLVLYAIFLFKKKRPTYENKTFLSIKETIFLLLIILSFTFYYQGISSGFLSNISYSLYSFVFLLFPGSSFVPLPALIPSLLILILSFYLYYYFPKEIFKMFIPIFILVLVIFNNEFFRVYNLHKNSSTLVELSRSKENLLSFNEKIPLNLSPSNFLIDKYYNSSIDAVNEIRHNSLNLNEENAIKNYTCIASASRNSEGAFEAIDSKDNTRWGTRGPQEKGDWFEISCSKDIVVRQVNLSITHFMTDYPRGFSVTIENDEGIKEIKKLDEWLGPVSYTDSGYPFFGSQGDVRIDFPEMLKFKRIRFTLTKGDPVFDWSIGKVVFLR